MNKRIVVLPGDGIGPEVTAQAIDIMQCINQEFGHEFEFIYDSIGAAAIDKFGEPLTKSTITTCLMSDAVLLGAIGDPKYDNNPSAKIRPEQGLLQLRKALNLYANIRPIKGYLATAETSPLKSYLIRDVDIVIYRELTGGLYFGKKTLDDTGKTATDTCTYTVNEIERIAIPAFEHALNRKRKLTLVDKANVLETSRLWRKVVSELSLEYPSVEVDYMYVDNAAMQLMLNPGQFDVILTENLFGDILSDLAGVISGSIGLLPSASKGNYCGLFEPVHGSYPQAKGKDMANPIGAILSATMLYEYFGLTKEANKIRQAVEWSLNKGICTKDINPGMNYLCSTVGESIVNHIKQSDLVEKPVASFI